MLQYPMNIPTFTMCQPTSPSYPQMLVIYPLEKNLGYRTLRIRNNPTSLHRTCFITAKRGQPPYSTVQGTKWPVPMCPLLGGLSSMGRGAMELYFGLTSMRGGAMELQTPSFQGFASLLIGRSPKIYFFLFCNSCTSNLRTSMLVFLVWGVPTQNEVWCAGTQRKITTLLFFFPWGNPEAKNKSTPTPTRYSSNQEYTTQVQLLCFALT